MKRKQSDKKLETDKQLEENQEKVENSQENTNEANEENKKLQKKAKVKKIIDITLDCILIQIFLIALIFTGSTIITRKTVGVPMFFNYALITVSSGSMIDAGFEIGSRAFIKRTNASNYDIGDYIAFFDFVDPNCKDPSEVTETNKPNEKALTSRIVFHEIIDVQFDEDGKKWFKTKGTNNALPDYNIIYENYVIGEYVKTSESTLNFINFVFSIKGVLIFVVLPCGIILFRDCLVLTDIFFEIKDERKLKKQMANKKVEEDDEK